jgi:hypothetical protein
VTTFVGGSAPAMVNQIAEGFFLVNLKTFRGWAKTDMNLLRVELDKALRDVRATVPPQDDARQNQVRNWKIGRLSSAIQILQGAMTGRPGSS